MGRVALAAVAATVATAASTATAAPTAAPSPAAHAAPALTTPALAGAPGDGGPSNTKKRIRAELILLFEQHSREKESIEQTVGGRVMNYPANRAKFEFRPKLENPPKFGVVLGICT